MEFDLIIPTYNAAETIGALLDSLSRQTARPASVLVIDSNSTDGTAEKVRAHEGVTLYTIDQAEFDHGLTRDRGLRLTEHEVVCFLTQDALPADNHYFAKLLEPLEQDESIAISSGRQLPRADARRSEQLVRGRNYPAHPNIRTLDNLDQYGLRLYSVSDVCSAYRRSAYLECGGFVALETNEDMYMAAKVLRAGYKICYAPEACVYHSHDYKLREQYERYKKIGRFLERYKTLLGPVSDTRVGADVFRATVRQLARELDAGELLYFLADSVARFGGNRVGRMQAARVPRARETGAR